MLIVSFTNLLQGIKINPTINYLFAIPNNIDECSIEFDGIPDVGQMFPTLDACHVFYCLYAGRVGFDINNSSQNIYLNSNGAR